MAYKPEDPGDKTWKETDPPAQSTYKPPEYVPFDPKAHMEGLPPRDDPNFVPKAGDPPRKRTIVTGMPPGGLFGSKDESPLAQEIRRMGEIKMQQLREKAERAEARFERQRKKWYWNAWWAVEWWFRDLFRHRAAATKPPKPADQAREKVKGTDIIAILIAFVALPVAMNTNDPLTAYVAYAVAWLVLIYLCLSHHAKAIWRVMASIAITLLLVFFCYRYWVTHREPAHAAQQNSIPGANLGCEIQEIKYSAEGSRVQTDGITKANGDFMGIVVTARIQNSGQPSITSNWRLKVMLPSGGVVESKAQYTPVTLTGDGPNRDPTLRDPTRYLPVALGETPLGNGLAKIGWVVFMFRNVAVEMAKPGTRFIMSFDDKDGKTITAEWPRKL